MGEVLKKFGRYFLLDHVAQGGMAEIYRARLASADGAGRLIVIKRIQAGFGANDEFLQMFKSEIKVTMGFNHPNIVQLYDFGEEQNQPYIAMELVDGKNLKQFINHAIELRQPFPIDLAVFIIEQSASGLHYAHSFKDKITGVPLSIVHRDISPQNILISYEGNVKVIDFGIAKATTNMEATRAGVIKGKPSYLSPEQISGDVLDGRSDIFALGAVLWETLTGRKLFAGDSDLAVLKQIESAQTHVKPPSTLNPKVPKELDYLVLKTLAKQKEKRFQSAEELQRALHKFLYSFFPDFNPGDLSYYSKELFKNEIVEDRKNIQKLNDKVEDLLSAELITNQSTTSDSSSSRSPDESTMVDSSRRSPTADTRIELNAQMLKGDALEIEKPRAFTPSPARPATRSSTPPGSSRVSSSPRATSATARSTAPIQRRAVQRSENSANGKYIAIGLVLLVGVSIFGPEFGVKVPVLSNLMSEWLRGSEARLVLRGNQKNVIVAINGQTVADALPATLHGIPVGTPFRVTVNGDQGQFQEEITLKKGEQKAMDIVFNSATGSRTTQSLATTGPGIMLRLNITPGGGNPKMSINGSQIDIQNPNVRVPLDAPLELMIDRKDFKPFRREFVLESRQIGGLKEWAMDVQMEPLHFGYLSIRTTPSAEATITLDGNPWIQKTPIENEKLPVGTYNVRLANQVLGMEKNVTVTIEEGRSINIDERLEIRN